MTELNPWLLYLRVAYSQAPAVLVVFSSLLCTVKGPAVRRYPGQGQPASSWWCWGHTGNRQQGQVLSSFVKSVKTQLRTTKSGVCPAMAGLETQGVQLTALTNHV